jgi:hypothetical protein
MSSRANRFWAVDVWLFFFFSFAVVKSRKVAVYPGCCPGVAAALCYVVYAIGFRVLIGFNSFFFLAAP